jgi:hypothetical protein
MHKSIGIIRYSAKTMLTKRANSLEKSVTYEASWHRRCVRGAPDETGRTRWLGDGLIPNITWPSLSEGARRLRDMTPHQGSGWSKEQFAEKNVVPDIVSRKWSRGDMISSAFCDPGSSYS